MKNMCTFLLGAVIGCILCNCCDKPIQTECKKPIKPCGCGCNCGCNCGCKPSKPPCRLEPFNLSNR